MTIYFVPWFTSVYFDDQRTYFKNANNQSKHL